MLDTEIRLLEEVGARTWPAAETEWLGGWYLSMDRGLTRRANSVLPLDLADGAVLTDSIDAVEDRYRERGLAPCFKMTRAARPDTLDAALDHRGYRAEGHSLVLSTTDIAGDAAPHPSVDLSSEMTPDWLESTWPDRMGDERWSGIVTRIGAPRAFALARVEGRAAGGALAAVDQGWACITAVHTLPAFRRQGVGRALLDTLLAWARGRASAAFLQVEADNEPAVRLYGSAGFRPAYRYHYRALRA